MISKWDHHSLRSKRTRHTVSFEAIEQFKFDQKAGETQPSAFLVPAGTKNCLLVSPWGKLPLPRLRLCSGLSPGKLPLSLLRLPSAGPLEFFKSFP